MENGPTATTSYPPVKHEWVLQQKADWGNRYIPTVQNTDGIFYIPPHDSTGV